MNTSFTRFRPLAALGGALLVASAVVAVGAGSAAAVRRPIAAVAYGLTAHLTAAQEVPAVQAPTGARGHWTAVLLRAGPGEARIAARAGCRLVTGRPRSGVPARIDCGGIIATLPPAGHWRLIWRLAVSDLSGPVTGVDVHLAPAGQSAATFVGLCGPCTPHGGSMTLTPAQGIALLRQPAYVNVATAANPGGEIRGQIRRLAPGGFVLGAVHSG
jgi:CHRD domain